MSGTVPYLLLMTVLPLAGMLFAFTAKDTGKASGQNVLHVTILTLVANLLLIFRAFTLIKPGYGNLQLTERYMWLENPHIELVFGADSFALLLIMGVYLAALVGLWGVKGRAEGQKPRMIFMLMFLSSVTGFFMSADIFSFFIFFLVMLLPLFMLVGMFGDIRKQGSVFRFMLYNLFGAMLLFAAIIVLYSHQNSSIMLGAVSRVKMSGLGALWVWLAIFAAFLSRIPIWPFHYWIASVNAGVKDPLAFIAANIMPLTGIYGFMRFWPKEVPEAVMYFMSALEAVSAVSMLVLALIGLINRDMNYKIFVFVTVYYVFFMLGVFLPTDEMLLNVGFSLFAFLLIFAVVAVLTAYVENEQESKNLSSAGILCSMPRLSAVFTFVMLAGAGLPLTAMFVNNFVITAALLSYNPVTALTAETALLLTAAAMLRELYRRKDAAGLTSDKDKATDISRGDAVFFFGAAVILVLSFFNPLWFLRG